MTTTKGSPQSRGDEVAAGSGGGQAENSSADSLIPIPPVPIDKEEPKAQPNKQKTREYVGF